MKDNQIIAEFMEHSQISECIIGCEMTFDIDQNKTWDWNICPACGEEATIKWPDYSSGSAPRKLLHEVELKLAEEGLWDVYIWRLEDMVRKSGSSEDCKQAKLRGCIDCKGTIYEPCSYVAFLIAIADAPTRVKAIVETLKGRE